MHLPPEGLKRTHGTMPSVAADATVARVGVARTAEPAYFSAAPVDRWGGGFSLASARSSHCSPFATRAPESSKVSCASPAGGDQERGSSQPSHPRQERPNSTSAPARGAGVRRLLLHPRDEPDSQGKGVALGAVGRPLTTCVSSRTSPDFSGFRPRRPKGGARGPSRGAVQGTP